MIAATTVGAWKEGKPDPIWVSQWGKASLPSTVFKVF